MIFAIALPSRSNRRNVIALVVATSGFGVVPVKTMSVDDLCYQGSSIGKETHVENFGVVTYITGLSVKTWCS